MSIETGIEELKSMLNLMNTKIDFIKAGIDKTTTTTTIKKEKKQKDPNAPTKPASAYILFGKAKREEIKKENPDLDGKEITKKIAEAWKEYKETNPNNEFQQEYEKLKETYDKAIEDYKNTSKEPKETEEPEEPEETEEPEEPVVKRTKKRSLLDDE